MLKSLAQTLLNHDVRMIELEFRVGIQTNAGFHAHVPKVVWNRSKSTFGDADETIILDQYVKNSDSGRYVYTASESYWERKKKLATETNPGEFSVRASLALEMKEPGPPPIIFTLQRKKYRTTFYKGPWKIDFSRVETIPNTADVEETYEIEVELYDTYYFFEKEMHLILEEGENLARSIVR